jgi:Holliday junction resolvase RusA-like endonuclease
MNFKSVFSVYFGHILRFRTKKYKDYEEHLLLILPNKVSIPEGDILLVCEFGLSKAFDIDNAVKPFQDVLQKKYGFNDNRITQLLLFKNVVKKGNHSYILNLLTSYILNFLTSYRQSSKLLVNS